jgi:hypothetical protein
MTRTTQSTYTIEAHQFHMMEFNTHALVDLSGVTQKTLTLISLPEPWYQVLTGLMGSLTHGQITVTPSQLWLGMLV